MRVEGHNTLSPVELNLHEAVEVGIVLGTREIVMSLDVGVSLRLRFGEEICDFIGAVVMDTAECFYF